jgi:hypothetical protein
VEGRGKQIERKFEEMRQNNEQSSSRCAESQKRLYGLGEGEKGIMKKRKSLFPIRAGSFINDP